MTSTSRSAARDVRGFHRERFTVSVFRVDKPEGTRLNVHVDGRFVGAVLLDDDGDGRLTRRARWLPDRLRLDRDDHVTVSDHDGKVLLSDTCADGDEHEDEDD